MTEAYEPPLEAKQEIIETEEQSPLIQAIKNLIENFREGFFTEKKPGAEEVKPQPVEKEYKTLDSQKINKLRVLFGIKAGEFPEAEDVVTIHEILKTHAGMEDEITDFINFDYTVILKINEARENETNLIRPLKEEINRIITVYVGRYMSKKEGQNRSPDQRGIRVAIKKEAAAPALPDIEVMDVDETDANVISIDKAKGVHAQHHQKLGGAENPDDNEPEPIQPKTNVA